MNAVTTALAERPLDASQVGEIFAAWQIAPDPLMLLGWQREKPARDGAVALQRGRGQRGRFTCIAWRFQEAGAEASLLPRSVYRTARMRAAARRFC